MAAGVPADQIAVVPAAAPSNAQALDVYMYNMNVLLLPGADTVLQWVKLTTSPWKCS